MAKHDITYFDEYIKYAFIDFRKVLIYSGYSNKQAITKKGLPVGSPLQYYMLYSYFLLECISQTNLHLPS